MKKLAMAGIQKKVAAPVEKPMRSVGVIGSRSLGYGYADAVGQVVEDLLGRGYHIASGGAIGADQFVIERLLHMGMSAQCTVYSAWENYDGFPVKVRAMMRQFKDYGGHLLWGFSAGKETPYLIKAALLLRNKRLVEACYGLVAFIDGQSRGSIFTINVAAAKRMPLVVFPAVAEAMAGRPTSIKVDVGILPELSFVKWVPLRCGGCWEGGFKAVYLK